MQHNPVHQQLLSKVSFKKSMEHLIDKWLYTLSISTVVLITICFINGLVSQNNRRKQRLPPGPRWSLPVIGHLHLLTKPPLHRTFQSLSAKYGPVLGLKLGNRYAVVVSSPAAVEECFVKNDIVLADRTQILAAKHLNYDSTSMIASNYNDHWRNVRRISNQTLFSVSRQSMFRSLRQDAVRHMIKSLFGLARQGKQKVEMKSRISEMAFNVVVGNVTGKRYYGEGAADSAEGEEFREILKEVFELSVASNLGDFIPFLGLVDYAGYEKKMLNVKKRLDVILQNLVDESKSKDGGAAQSMLRNMLLLQEADSAAISDKTIKGLMLVLTAGGTEPTADAIEWAMSALLNVPKKLKEAQKEIDTMIGPGKLVDEHDLSKLKYLQAVVNETQRMYPTAPLLAPHYSSGECTIQGFYVPRGTMIFVNAWAIQRDPNLWEDPLRFNPERFENAEESHVHKFFPFGIGRRSCPGSSMAHKVMMLALASLIQCFDWERIGEEKVDMSECDRPHMFKRTPLEALCQPRNNMVDLLSSL